MAVDGGAGQVVLPKDNTTGLAAWHFATDYWIIDGAPYIVTDTSATWGHVQSHSCTGNQCGFKMDATNALSPSGTWGINYATGVHNITVRAVEAAFNGLTAAQANQQATAFRMAGTSYTNINVSHCHLHDSPDTYVQYSSITFSVTYTWFERSFAYASTQHGEAFAGKGCTNCIIAFNDFQDITGTGMVVDLNTGTGNTDNLQIYSNLFRFSSGSSLPGSGNGFIACINSNTCTNWKIYNNVFSNVKPTTSTFNGISFGSAASGSSFTAQNNIFFNNGDVSHQLCAGCTGTFNSNYYTQNTTTPVGETGEQSDSATPFTNWTADNYHLTTDTTAWAPLSSPYNVDTDGVTRTSSRGTFQFAGGTVVALGTALIPSLHCAAAVNTTATGLLSTDVVIVSFNAAPSGAYLTGLTILPPDVAAGSFNIRVCNPTAGSLTPPAATLNWRVVH